MNYEKWEELRKKNNKRIIELRDNPENHPPQNIWERSWKLYWERKPLIDKGDGAFVAIHPDGTFFQSSSLTKVVNKLEEYDGDIGNNDIFIIRYDKEMIESPGISLSTPT